MVRTRFAPSPTGYLHIGGVRTALFNWLYARRHGGQFILRIDDTDHQRNVAEALAPILSGFEWLGIDWDEGPEPGRPGESRGPKAPYYQSQRDDRYAAAVEQLLAAGAAYRDYATTEELAAEREAAESEDDIRRFESEGRQAVVRLKMPAEGHCEFNDLILGPQRVAWTSEQDHVVQRADGSCLYHLATVVDDHDFDITHVIRAQEHLSNTPRQLFIHQALGWRPPEHAHIPVVAEPGSKAKLSKRKLDKYLKNREFKKVYEQGRSIAERLNLETDPATFNPVVVDFYREVGYLPGAVVNYLLLLGWSYDDSREDFTREEMIESFSLERVVKSPASFDPAKLAAFQERHMNRLPLKQKAAKVLPFLQRAGLVADPPPCDVGPKLQAICQAAGDRIKVAGDILDYAFLFLDDADFRPDADEKAYQKRLAKPPEAKDLLAELRERLAAVDPFQAESLEREIKQFVEYREIKIGQIIHALRLAVTGQAVGFGMFETLEILGRDRCLARIEKTLAGLSAAN